MSQITAMICERIVEQLTLALQTNIPLDDPSRADVVCWGRYRDEPLVKNIHAAIVGGDPDDPNYRDGAITLQEIEKGGYRFPHGEIGGMRMWYRRGIVQLGCYFINEQYDQVTAARYAYETLGRVQYTLPHIYVGDLVDTNDEHAVKLFCYSTTFSESGGPPGSYIWRGKIFWHCLTEVMQT